MQVDNDALVRVKKAIEKYEDLKIITFETDTSTSELAARALGIATGQIAKSLCFTGDGQPFLVISVGDRKIDTKKLSKQLLMKKIKFADAHTTEQATGFTPGGVCPFALATALPIYLDKSLYKYEVVYAAAGTSNSVLPVTPQKLLEITGARLIEATLY